MTPAPHADDIITGYLARLGADADDLPRADRVDLIESVREHIAEARYTLSDETDADLLNILDRLGSPADLVEDERERLGVRAPEPARIGLLETGALVLTPLFWPVGVILLWASGMWNTRDKLIGTLLFPGGLFTSFLVFSLVATGRLHSHAFCHTVYNSSGHVVSHSCQSDAPPAIVTVALLIALVAVMLVPVFTGIYLALQARRRVRHSTPAMTYAIA